VAALAVEGQELTSHFNPVFPLNWSKELPFRISLANPSSIEGSISRTHFNCHFALFFNLFMVSVDEFVVCNL